MADEVNVPVEKGQDISYSNDEQRLDMKMTTLGRFRYSLRDYIAEFWGTFILIAFGDGVVLQTVLSNSTHGNQVTINICWGIAVIMGIYTSGGISGAHLNPAVTLTLAIFRKFPWKKVIGYWVAQGAGAFLAAALLYINFIQAFNSYDGGLRAVPNLGLPNATAGIFSTYPALFMTTEGALFDQVVTTAVLLFGIFAINDMGNTGAGSLGPLMVGLHVMAIGMAFGWQTGYAINPARDMGPRMFAFFVYGSDVFTAGSSLFSGYAWIPIVGPLVGAPIGALLYDLFMFTGEGPLQTLFRRS
jgi:aquaglyceroporin related protein